MNRKEILTLVEKMNRKDLIGVIEVLTLYNPDAQETLLNYCEKTALPEDQDFIHKKLILNHWENAYIIIDKADTNGGCSENEEDIVCYEINSLVNQFNGNNISWEIKKAIIDAMLDQNIFENSGFTEFLVESLMEICQSTQEQEYLADNLRKSTQSYYKRLGASIYRAIGKDHAFLEAIKVDLKYSSEYLSLANYYDEKKDDEMAIKILWEGLKKSEGRLDQIYVRLFEKLGNNESKLLEVYNIAKKKQMNLETVTELLVTYYTEHFNYPNQKKMMIEMVHHCKKKDLGKWYSICKENMKKNDWAKHEKSILNTIKERSHFEYLTICMEKGNTREVLEVLKEQPVLIEWNHVDAGHNFSKPLSKIFPNEIAILYWNEVQANMNLMKRKSYYNAVIILKEIKKIMIENNEEERWIKAYDKLMEEHKRKRLFVGMAVNAL